jgi:hypothetical protein
MMPDDSAAVQRSSRLVAFVHMPVAVQGLLITGTGFALLGLNWSTRARWAGVAAYQDWVLFLPALLAALYLMASEKILRDVRTLGALSPQSTPPRLRGRPYETLSRLFLRTRTLYHFLMLCCFVCYVATQAAPPGGRAAQVLFHLEWGLIVVLFAEFLRCHLRQSQVYAAVLLAELAARGRADEGRTAQLVAAVRRDVADDEAGRRPAALEAARALQAVAVAASLACAGSVTSGHGAPLGLEAARWLSNLLIVVLGLTFSWVDVRRERFLTCARNVGAHLEAGLDARGSAA